MKAKFLIVVHTWHVSSKGFYTKTVICEEKQAEKEAAIFAYEKSSSFCKSDFLITRIEDSDFVVNHKLSWKERLTGILDYF